MTMSRSSLRMRWTHSMDCLALRGGFDCEHEVVLVLEVASLVRSQAGERGRHRRRLQTDCGDVAEVHRVAHGVRLAAAHLAQLCQRSAQCAVVDVSSRRRAAPARCRPSALAAQRARRNYRGRRLSRDRAGVTLGEPPGVSAMTKANPAMSSVPMTTAPLDPGPRIVLSNDNAKMPQVSAATPTSRQRARRRQGSAARGSAELLTATPRCWSSAGHIPNVALG